MAPGKTDAWPTMVLVRSAIHEKTIGADLGGTCQSSVRSDCRPWVPARPFPPTGAHPTIFLPPAISWENLAPILLTVATTTSFLLGVFASLMRPIGHFATLCHSYYLCLSTIDKHISVASEPSAQRRNIGKWCRHMQITNSHNAGFYTHCT
ncbi:hypothetical protein BDW66DRAFT_23186 [Aspergillus desertorum]